MDVRTHRRLPEEGRGCCCHVPYRRVVLDNHPHPAVAPGRSPLRLVNVQSPIADPFWRAVSRELGVRVDEDGDWRERRRRLEAGEVELGFLCGLPYARAVDAGAASFEPLVAPVMEAARYGGRPIYFSDVVVRQDSSFNTFADLAGRTWAYNEPDSHSGCWVVRYELARRSAPRPFFGRVVESGAHLTSLAMVVDGRVDAAAIDSTVLELALRDRPALSGALRVIETWGPSPMPPLLVAGGVAPDVRRRLRDALLGMHEHPAGRAALSLGLVERFVAVADGDYDALRSMACLAEAQPLAF